jgi:hypothetical protein
VELERMVLYVSRLVIEAWQLALLTLVRHTGQRVWTDRGPPAASEPLLETLELVDVRRERVEE